MKRLLLLLPTVSFLLIHSTWSRPADFQKASSVLGQPNFVTGDNQPVSAQSFVQPEAIVIDPTTGKVFVSDTGGNRILRFSSTAAYQTNATAEAVLGQDDIDETETSPVDASSLDEPGGMAFDSQGNLYVADYGNARVLRWENPSTIATGTPANAVIGQDDLMSNDSPGAGPHSDFSGPWALAIDSADNLYIGDYDLHRVLRFTNAPSLSGRVASSAVFGQPDLSSFGTGTDPGAGPTLTGGILNYLWGLVVDDTGTLWISDTDNHRVVRFDGAATKTSGALPDGVLGQPDFATTNTVFGPSSFEKPRRMAMDDEGTLWVSDHGHDRVVGFENAGSLPGTGTNNANFVLGQPDLMTEEFANFPTERNLDRPYGIAVTPEGGLLVADERFLRVMHFRDQTALQNDLLKARLKMKLQRQLKQAKEALKRAKKSGKKSRIKALKKKIKKLKKRIAQL